MDDESEYSEKSIDWQLKNLKTDYIDFGFIHCLDEERDLIDYERNGVLKFILDLKEQGVVRHIGLSTHAPELANKVMDKNILDILMFSINPMYDYGQGTTQLEAVGKDRNCTAAAKRRGSASRL